MTDAGWIAHFPGLERLPANLRASMVKGSTVITLPKGSRIYGPGQAPAAYLLLLEGTLSLIHI